MKEEKDQEKSQSFFQVLQLELANLKFFLRSASFAPLLVELLLSVLAVVVIILILILFK